MAENRGNPYHDSKTGRFTSGPGGAKSSVSLPKRRPGRTAFPKSAPSKSSVVSATKDLLVSQEGYKKRVYIDSEGFPTVGIGHKLPNRYKELEGRAPFTEKELNRFFELDSASAYDNAKDNIPGFSRMPVSLQAALVSQAFQLGKTGQRKFKNMIDAIEAGDWREAAEQALDSNWAKQTPKRARHLANELLKIRDGEK